MRPLRDRAGSARSLATTLALAAENGRICPKPAQWARLYELLPDTRHDGYGQIPAGPLASSAWSDTADMDKIARLREHLQWAEQHGALERVHRFLAGLPEGEWHHAGD